MRAHEIAPSELKQRLSRDRSRPLILDVRSPDEFAAGHIPAAVNIPLDQLVARAATLEQDRLVVTVCGKGGGRSSAAADLLIRAGFPTVAALSGGQKAWDDQTEQA